MTYHDFDRPRLLWATRVTLPALIVLAGVTLWADLAIRVSPKPTLVKNINASVPLKFTDERKEVGMSQNTTPTPACVFGPSNRAPRTSFEISQISLPLGEDQ